MSIGPLPGLEAIQRIVGPVAEQFRTDGFRLYLVGGVVRDLTVAQLWGTEPPGFDIDLTTDARPPDIKRILAPFADDLWTQGERFGTIGATVSGETLEITTHRAEVYDPASRKPVISFGDNLVDDLSRRDFTINAAAMELPSATLHDPFDGLTDLAERVLRTPLAPTVSFSDDPLRMLRAARFIPRFSLSPAPELVKAATDLADRMEIVSVERVADELHRLLAVAQPRSGFSFLLDTGLLAQALIAYRHRPESELELAAELASAPGSVVVRRAGLLWPLGPAGAKAELARLNASNQDRQATAALMAAALLVIESTVDGGRPVSAALIRRAAAQVGLDALPAVGQLLTNLGGELGPSFASLATELSEVEDLSRLGSPLTGAEVMATLAIEPGPEVGAASAYLREQRIERGPLQKPEAQALLRSWWAAQHRGQE